MKTPAPFKLLNLAIFLFSFFCLTFCSSLKPVDTIAAKVAIDKIKVKPTGGGLEFQKDNFFEDDVTLALGSAWITSPKLTKARILPFGLDEVRPSGGKTKEAFRLYVKKDSVIDLGVSDIFGAKLTDSNAITVTVTSRSMTTNFSLGQLQKWAESVSDLIDGQEAYVAFVMKITENIINTEEFTQENYNGNLAISSIKIGNASYGSAGNIKTTEPIIWIGLTACKWKRIGNKGKPGITIISPEEYKNQFIKFQQK
ncbi:hypothetical protein [Leptospira kmetyi]|uniref:Uncharacterized protein n=1 Tax=Leptospira kmetyi TaxID=408139 RepID=A0ABX4N8B8_9LEPT|nr:hypothetical protein [Leptospira kmetyi]PJZ28332.1 hypothetical protein CH378_18620 [Leptospira kmetyi]